MYRNQSQYSSVRLDHEAIHNLEAEPLVGITERKIGLALIDPRRLMRWPARWAISSSTSSSPFRSSGSQQKQCRTQRW
jgi:hypothetical protein